MRSRAVIISGRAFSVEGLDVGMYYWNWHMKVPTLGDLVAENSLTESLDLQGSAILGDQRGSQDRPTMRRFY